MRHPDPLSPPDGFEAFAGAPDLYYRLEAAWGGSVLLSTEALAVVLFNAGYPLEEIVLSVSGKDAEGREVFAIEGHVAELPRGEERRVEVPSYELPAPAKDITVTLVSARFGCAM